MRDNMRMKKVLSILLCLCIVLSYVPMPALAEEVTCTHHVHEGCTFDPSTCADCAVITNQPADWCGNSLCSQEDNAHAPGCAWYVRTYEECKCVLSCSEEGLNDYCETCFFEGVDACGGEEEAIVFTDFEISDGRLIKYNGSGGNITIPETVTSIDVYAFDGCSSLESVTIPGSVTTIWNYAFRNCTNLRSVTISGSVETINSYAFLGCSSLQSVTISGSVTTIGNHVFNACSNLRSLTISGSVTTIGNYAFNGCSGLEEITISGSVTTIVNNAFNGCTGLTTVNVPCNWENSLYNFGDNVNVQKADHSFGTDGKCICGAECSHSYDAEGKCTVCNCVGGIIDVSTLTSDLMITDTGYSMNGKTYLYNGAYTLTGTTSHGVIFEAGEYQLTANNLKIVKGDNYTGSAVELKNGANLHLVLADGSDNTLTGGWEGSGIRVNEGASLTISGNGILRAGYQRGGNAAYGAAIGGYCNNNFGSITINGGTIYASGSHGASIGSGNLYNTSNTMTGTIVLNGGTIYADLIGNAASNGAVLKGSGATVYCDSIQADTSEFNAIVYSKDGTSATAYGNVTLTDDFVVPSSGLTVKEGAVLTVPEGKTLTVAQDRQLICYGSIVNNGTIAGAGTVANCLAQSDLTGSGTVAETVFVKTIGSHVYGQWEPVDANIHKKTCQNGCGKTLTEAHTLENDVCTVCGRTTPWRYDATGKMLYIYADHAFEEMYDIWEYDVECIIIAEGVMSVPDFAFDMLYAHEVKSVHIPESLETVGRYAFEFGHFGGNTVTVFYCPEDLKDTVKNSSGGGSYYGGAKVYVSYKMENGAAKVTAVEVSDPTQIDSNAVLDTVLYGKNVYFADGTLIHFPKTTHVHRGTQWTNNGDRTCTGLCVVCGKSNVTQSHDYSDAVLDVADNTKHAWICKCCGDSQKEAHSYTYTASGNRISAVCSCGHTGSLVINEINPQTYTGNKVQVTLNGAIDGVTPVITYCCEDGCVNAGTHTAKVVLGNAEATMQFEILKAEPEIGVVTAGVVNDTLEISAIVLNRENTNVAGALTVDADQTIVLGQNQIKYTFVPVDTTNYKTVTGTVTVTVTDTIAPVIGGIENGKTYYTTRGVAVTDENIDTITLNGEAVTSTITLEGNKEATYIIVATDKAGNTTTVTVKMAPIADIAESMEGMTSDNVTSDDKAALQTIMDTATELLRDEELPAEEKEALEKAKADAEALLRVIEDADKAADTENTDKVENVTADNVTPDDKSDLEKAKTDLKKALDDNGGNYTAEEKKAIEDELKRIDDALKVIENVEAVEDVTSNLPATVEPDDEETIAKIEAAKKSYNELTDYEKSLVNPETKEKLDKLTNGIVAYDIVKGDGSAWTKGADGSITFTVNGPISKFSGIKIDGKAVDAQYYDIKAGSTIITLKASYLETLAAGEHSITVVYTDGETSGTFNVQAKSTNPATGDDSNILLWTTMFFVSLVAMAVLVISRKSIFYKAKYARK